LYKITVFVSDIWNIQSVYCGSDKRPRLFIVTFSVFAGRTQSLNTSNFGIADKLTEELNECR